MSETFVRLKPTRAVARGAGQGRAWSRRCARRSTEIPGVSFNFSQPIKDNVEEAVSGVRGKVVLKIFGTDLDVMRETLEEAVRALAKVPGIVDLDLYRDSSVPQLQIVLDRAALARAGISVDDAQDVVETALGGNVATELWEDERPVPVRVMLAGGRARATRRASATSRCRPATAAACRCASSRSIETAIGRAAINREANSRLLALKFNVEGRDMGSVVTEAHGASSTREVKVPDGHFFVWGGEFENQQRAMARLAVIVPIAFLVVFVLLYSALGSARSALAVLLAAPFAMTGGVFALALAGIPLSVSAAVGFIALLGQVWLASLLVVSAVDDRRRDGEELMPALVGGAASRFRAVLMTALLAILGLMPMALSDGRRQRDAAAVRGGDHRRPGHRRRRHAVRAAVALQPDRAPAPATRQTPSDELELEVSAS